jgi:mannosyltransferase OCH1-like enzyme
MLSAKSWNFFILIFVFSIYLIAKWLDYIPGFSNFNTNIEIDKIILVLITLFGYYLKINIYWIASFFFVFMTILISNDTYNKKGAVIDVIHEYDVDPEKKTSQIKNAVIPLHIYQTWNTKRLPSKMKECVDRLKHMNPEFTHHLFDDDDCRNYIQKNFDTNVLQAYDTLIPGAYKADLWRYCVLYKEGGIYMDIKLQCEPNFRLLELVDKEHFVLDRPYIRSISLKDELAWIQSPHYSKSVYSKVDANIWENGNIGLYNAFMVSKPHNPILKECIDIIVENTKKKIYGYGPLYPTGPGLLGNVYFRGNQEKIYNIDLYNSLNGDCILTRNKKILTHYSEYRKEQVNHGTQHYHHLWKKKRIYKKYDH